MHRSIEKDDVVEWGDGWQRSTGCAPVRRRAREEITALGPWRLVPGGRLRQGVTARRAQTVDNRSGQVGHFAAPPSHEVRPRQDGTMGEAHAQSEP